MMRWIDAGWMSSELAAALSGNSLSALVWGMSSDLSAAPASAVGAGDGVDPVASAEIESTVPDWP